ncbi:hypothetical protein AAHE18_09G155500 [Arachis hypogaea]
MHKKPVATISSLIPSVKQKIILKELYSTPSFPKLLLKLLLPEVIIPRQVSQFTTQASHPSHNNTRKTLQNHHLKFCGDMKHGGGSNPALSQRSINNRNASLSLTIFHNSKILLC